MSTLQEIHADIDARVAMIRAGYSDWPCHRGCEGCCHRLAEIPRLTEAEWRLLSKGLALLDEKLLRRICKDVAALGESLSRPIVCPLLDRNNGTCLVYMHRPIACRTYGFYVQRDKGLYCNDIESLVFGGALSNVVWGNQDAIDRCLKSTGEVRELTLWFANWEDRPHSSEKHSLIGCRR